jgi:UDP-3-O-[3-hydroxymyristoyl] glucosamine N-acyltransferase
MTKTLQELAEHVGGTVLGDGSILISGIAGIEEAREGEITFLSNPRYAKKVKETKASALIAAQEVEGFDRPILLTENPYLAYAKIVGIFHEISHPAPGIDDQAIIGKRVKIGKGCSISPFVFIGEEAEIGDRVIIYPFVFIGKGVKIGDDTLIHAHCSIRERCIIGRWVIIHCGSVIGSDGFGFVRDGKSHYKIPQVGIVQVDDDVEIGANCTIDRAALGRTWVKQGVKMDNLVHIAHNVVVGENTILVAQVGISGSTEIGNNVSLAGQVGIIGHLKIGDNAMVGAKSGVATDVEAGKVVSGIPAYDHRDWLKTSMTLPKLSEMRKQLHRLLKEVEELKLKLNIGSKE